MSVPRPNDWLQWLEDTTAAVSATSTKGLLNGRNFINPANHMVLGEIFSPITKFDGWEFSRCLNVIVNRSMNMFETDTIILL